MNVFKLSRIEKNRPEYTVELSGDDINLIEESLLELFDNVQYEGFDLNEKQLREESINKVLMKLGNM